MEKIVYATVALMAVTMLSYYIYGTMISLSERHDDEICKESVFTNYLLSQKGIESDEILCPTKYTTIKGNEKKALAEELERCWWMHHEGKLELFSEEKIYCSVCSVVRFEGDGTLEGFGDYMMTAERKDGSTYLSYLASVETERAADLIQDDNAFQQLDMASNSIDRSKPHSIIFVYAKGENWVGELFDTIGRTTTTLTVGTVSSLGSGAVFFLVTPAGAVWGVSAVAAALSVGTIAGFAALFAEEDAHTSFIILKEHQQDELRDLGCQVFPAVQKDIQNE
ncbi:hypothetical protein H6504_03505 [Candidatus Woesearchaeota archaeon]|nr:hypothetical protein [Candidatus Woesearchaeota archaeon]